MVEVATKPSAVVTASAFVRDRIPDWAGAIDKGIHGRVDAAVDSCDEGFEPRVVRRCKRVTFRCYKL